MNPQEELHLLYLRLKEEEPSVARGEALWAIFEETADDSLRFLSCTFGRFSCPLRF